VAEVVPGQPEQVEADDAPEAMADQHDPLVPALLVESPEQLQTIGANGVSGRHVPGGDS